MFSEKTDLTIDSRFMSTHGDLFRLNRLINSTLGSGKLLGDKVVSLTTDVDFEASYESAFSKTKQGGLAYYHKFFSDTNCDCCGRELNILTRDGKFNLCISCNDPKYYNSFETKNPTPSSQFDILNDYPQQYLVL